MLEFFSLPDRCSADEFLAAAASATETEAAMRATNAKKWFIVVVLTVTEETRRARSQTLATLSGMNMKNRLRDLPTLLQVAVKREEKSRNL